MYSLDEVRLEDPQVAEAISKEIEHTLLWLRWAAP